MRDRFQQGRRVSTVSVSVNGALALIKLLTGIVGNSYALVADAIESLGDIISSLVVWGGLTIAARPADADHPYGHGKAEPLAALIVAAMLLFSAALIAFQAIREIITPHHAPEWYTLPVLLVVVAIKEGMYRYESRAGRRIGSTAVLVDAWHHRSDALTSLAASVGIAVAIFGGPGFEPADDWAALFACVFIVGNSLRFAREAVTELMDTSPDIRLSDEIRSAAGRIPGVRDVEKMFIRKMGPYFYVDLHLNVDAAMTVREAHDIAHRVKDAIRARWPEVADVLVHVEPFPHDDDAAMNEPG